MRVTFSSSGLAERRSSAAFSGEMGEKKRMRKESGERRLRKSMKRGRSFLLARLRRAVRPSLRRTGPSSRPCWGAGGGT
jgi:hypothetical protein